MVRLLSKGLLLSQSFSDKLLEGIKLINNNYYYAVSSDAITWQPKFIIKKEENNFPTFPKTERREDYYYCSISALMSYYFIKFDKKGILQDIYVNNAESGYECYKTSTCGASNALIIKSPLFSGNNLYTLVNLSTLVATDGTFSYNGIEDVTYWRGRFYMSGQYTGTGFIRYSTDAVTWTTISAKSNYFGLICYNDNMLIVFPNSHSSTAYYTTNGTSFLSINLPCQNIKGSFYVNNRFISFSYYNYVLSVLISQDGINWSSSKIDFPDSINNIVFYALYYVKNQYLCYCGILKSPNETTFNNYRMYSLDGISWSIDAISAEDIVYMINS